MPKYLEPKDLDSALKEQDLDRATAVFVSLTGWDVLSSALDEEDEILYIAARQEGSIRGFCCFISEPMEMVVIPETHGPFYIGAPRHLIEMLDPTFSESAVRWRRDCLAMYYRTMAEKAHIPHPSWVTYYSEHPLGNLKYAAHLAVVVGGAPQGLQQLAITDGVSWKMIEVPVDALDKLVPVWTLEWTMAPMSIMAMRGRGALRYIGVGPPDFRVGMLFNDFGGLVTWSGAATHCELMATMADGQESGFTRVMLLNQLNQWQGKSATVVGGD